MKDRSLTSQDGVPVPEKRLHVDKRDRISFYFPAHRASDLACDVRATLCDRERRQQVESSRRSSGLWLRSLRDESWMSPGELGALLCCDVPHRTGLRSACWDHTRRILMHGRPRARVFFRKKNAVGRVRGRGGQGRGGVAVHAVRLGFCRLLRQRVSVASPHVGLETYVRALALHHARPPTLSYLHWTRPSMG